MGSVTTSPARDSGVSIKSSSPTPVAASCSGSRLCTRRPAPHPADRVTPPNGEHSLFPISSDLPGGGGAVRLATVPQPLTRQPRHADSSNTGRITPPRSTAATRIASADGGGRILFRSETRKPTRGIDCFPAEVWDPAQSRRVRYSLTILPGLQNNRPVPTIIQTAPEGAILFFFHEGP